MKIWSFARFDLHLSEDEFWSLTPVQFNALSGRYAQQQDWLNYRAGLIAAVIANVNRDPKKRRDPFTPQDFIQRTETEKPVPENLQDKIRRINAAMGGSEIKKNGQ